MSHPHFCHMSEMKSPPQFDPDASPRFRQYESGTTDVTRTVHLGTPTAWEKEAFTRVLQGHIALASVTFPNGTPGMAIDAFARSATTPPLSPPTH